MEPPECLVFDEEDWEETLDDDVEMVDAVHVDTHRSFPAGEADLLAGNPPCVGGGGEEARNCAGGADVLDSVAREPRRKRNKKKKKKGGSATIIPDINRFVINTCRQLKEKKSYLIWNAVGCLGVSAISDLVKEVEAVQRNGGQKTVDGKRFRTGGGVLWNILKIRDPNAYKEIMAKGKEFEKQFKQPQNSQISKRKDVSTTQHQTVPRGAAECPVTDSLPTRRETEISASPKRRSVRDRIRVPVTYDDDILEEGELYESPLLT
ncbi:hypothetical protein KSP39_PZI022470 [Platanthera zijinensis]|uniref:Phosphorylated adapter RNA export protein n=1 Tax=Platanthera zijinensis TaxID=2320716 RepID=A0AAP0AUM7_9ASPA